MNTLIRKSWEGLLSPMLRRPSALQLAALCWRRGKKGIEVLLVTSSQGRWILPKGWPIDGLDGSGAALQEAWEEAGVKQGRASAEPVGTFDCRKRFDDGTEVPCRTHVYGVEVLKTTRDYPEQNRRDRQWVSPKKAVKLVDEPGLQEILSRFSV